MRIFFYALIFITGLLSSYTDIREKKIKNRHLLIITCLALLGYIVFWFTGLLRLGPNFFINPLISLLIGFVLYAVRLWKAGDAKLFFTYSLLLPVNNYAAIVPFSCLSLLIHTFLISFITIVLISLPNIISNKNRIIKNLLSRQTVRFFTNILLITFGIFWILQPFLNLLPLKNNIFLNLVILWISYSTVSRFIATIKRRTVLIVLFAAGLIARFYFMPEFFTILNLVKYMKGILLYAVLFYILSLSIKFATETQKRIPFAPFMFLGAVLTHTHCLLWIMRALMLLRM